MSLAIFFKRHLKGLMSLSSYSSSSSHRALIVIITLITFGFGFDFGVNDVVRHLLPDLGLCFDLVDARRPVDGKILLPGRRTVAGRGLHLGLQLDVARQVLNDLKNCEPFPYYISL